MRPVLMARLLCSCEVSTCPIKIYIYSNNAFLNPQATTFCGPLLSLAHLNPHRLRLAKHQEPPLAPRDGRDIVVPIRRHWPDPLLSVTTMPSLLTVTVRMGPVQHLVDGDVIPVAVADSGAIGACPTRVGKGLDCACGAGCELFFYFFFFFLLLFVFLQLFYERATAFAPSSLVVLFCDVGWLFAAASGARLVECRLKLQREEFPWRCGAELGCGASHFGEVRFLWSRPGSVSIGC